MPRPPAAAAAGPAPPVVFGAFLAWPPSSRLLAAASPLAATALPPDTAAAGAAANKSPPPERTPAAATAATTRQTDLHFTTARILHHATLDLEILHLRMPKPMQNGPIPKSVPLLDSLTKVCSGVHIKLPGNGDGTSEKLFRR
ncbi:hypothetical protein NL676_030876 [Syzygium grande]|nr:hypothetical protein NL676_030876 [Syzygium grande]